MFSEMRAALGHRAGALPQPFAGAAAPGLDHRARCSRLRHPRGARTVGLADKVGTITPGKSADLILVPRHALNLAPMGDPIGALVLGGHAGNVEAVIVEGAAVKWNGRMIGADVRRALELLERSREYLYAQALAHDRAAAGAG